jgi:tRNA A37 threonylcarbamoyladenosine modification protein TsaB
VLWSRWRALADQPIVLAGDAVAYYAEHAIGASRLLPHPLLAPAVGRLARRAAEAGSPQSPHDLQPLYVRRPDVERA